MKDNNEDGSAAGGPVRDPAARVATAAPTSEPQAQATELGRANEKDGATGLKPVSADMQQFIGRQLRAVFDDVAKQPVPDRFLELMKQLDQKTGTG